MWGLSDSKYHIFRTHPLSKAVYGAGITHKDEAFEFKKKHSGMFSVSPAPVNYKGQHISSICLKNTAQFINLSKWHTNRGAYMCLSKKKTSTSRNFNKPPLLLKKTINKNSQLKMIRTYYNLNIENYTIITSQPSTTQVNKGTKSTVSLFSENMTIAHSPGHRNVFYPLGWNEIVLNL